jgi:hypothetical protein
MKRKGYTEEQIVYALSFDRAPHRMTGRTYISQQIPDLLIQQPLSLGRL